mmetsp:Transcript_7961/g.17959  ORF Transcript_7961/g.17959 Transcript_7961/m.17959 type:complete len:445 (-) Transcript_7961:198-1532(-)|eukprot:CAMPEP_0172316948 /NCGR_PEP_ID=MMETSP1058-20130122/30105_1 /TAXON_ID=83371 /ORGANISM="Detonula confervacea, Strain CCMP 353" /LENGTH=444 /DNA_ID=CAMNT_0013031389 /DNA_START=184 /DNA_END=1518 /DNA_ORIENTATION=-
MGKKSRRKGGKKTSTKNSDFDDRNTPKGEGLSSKGLSVKAKLDELAAMMANEEHTKDLTKEELGLSHLLMAYHHKGLAEHGIVEDEKHSSLVWCEEHADDLFEDGGEIFFQQEMKDATDKVELKMKRKEAMEKFENEGDLEGQLRLLRSQMCELDIERDAWLASKGLPPADNRLTEEDLFVGTIVDDDLFAPCPPRPDCPICFLSLPLRTCTTYQPCCGKTLCDGCIYAHRNSSLEYSCPFCRASCDNSTDKDRIKMMKKRIEFNDKEAMYMMAGHYHEGSMGLKQDRSKSFELFSRAAELGLSVAHHTVGMAYLTGIMGVKKDEKKAMHHLRLAAIGGVLESRYVLGAEANQAGKRHGVELAMKHWIIAANAGHDESLEAIKDGYAQGYVTNEVFTKVLRAHEAATDETKSDQRDQAASARASLPSNRRKCCWRSREDSGKYA